MNPSRVLFIEDEDALRRYLARSLSSLPVHIDLANTSQQALEMASKNEYASMAVDLDFETGSSLSLIRSLRELQPHASYMLVCGTVPTEILFAAVNDYKVEFLLHKPWSAREAAQTFRASLKASKQRAKHQATILTMSSATHAFEEERRRLKVAIEQSATQMAETLLNVMAGRGHESIAHCRRVAAYAVATGRQLGLSGNELTVIQNGALLHDLGKVVMPDDIFTKRDLLTPDEWDAVRRHPAAGAAMLDGIPQLAGAREILLQHHERFDGTGYPQGLKGEEICIGARIFAIADTFDALSSKRSYHSSLPLEEAIHEIAKGAGSKFDVHAVGAFARVPRAYLVGTLTKFT